MSTAASMNRRSFGNPKFRVSRTRIAAVVAAVSAERRIPAVEITGEKRHQEIVSARWEVWRRLVNSDRVSVRSLAADWGCDRTTILNALNKMERQQESLAA